MPTRLERAEAETARVTTSTGKARQAERELYRLWSAFRSEPLAIALWQGNAPDEPPKVLVDLARSGTRVLHQAIDGIGATPKAVTALIRDPGEEPVVEPTVVPASESSEREQSETEWESEPVDPADEVERRINRLERSGLWDPGR
jgi:hypothetical protein